MGIYGNSKCNKHVLKSIKICGFIAIFILQFMGGCFLSDASSQKETEVVRVAFLQYKNFYQYNERGYREGFGVDLLKELEKISNLRFEYVDMETNRAVRKALAEGTVDMVMPYTKLDVSGEALDVGSESILQTSYSLYAKSDNEKLVYGSKNALDHLSVGICEGLYRGFEQYNLIERIPVNKNQLVLFDNYVETKEALLQGKIDVLITNGRNRDEILKDIYDFHSEDASFAVLKGNDVLRNKLDKAINELKLQKPLFLSQNYEKWYMELEEIPLTVDEKEALANKGYLNFGFHVGQGYLNRVENGENVGIYKEFAKCLCEKLGIEYREVIIDNKKILEMMADDESVHAVPQYVKSLDIDVWGDMICNSEWADTLNANQTSSYYDLDYYYVTQVGNSENYPGEKIALVKGQYYAKHYEKIYGEENVVWCYTAEECLEAVRSGKADGAYILAKAAEYYLKSYKYSSLRVSMDDYKLQICMALACEDPDNLLLSAINKVIPVVKRQDMNGIIGEVTTVNPKQNPYMATLYSNPITSTGIICIFGFLVVGLIGFALSANNNRKKNEQLTKAMNAKSDFLSRMSHDLRTPLNVIIGMNQLALDDVNVPTEAHQCLEKSQKAADYLLGLLNDILDMSRIESGKLSLQKRILNIQEIRKEIYEMTQNLAKQKNIEIITNLKRLENYYIIADPLRLKQIFMNILSNAVKYSPEGSIITWKTTCQPLPGNMVRITTIIEDQGCGMSPEFLAKVFEPFEMESNPFTNKTTGTGLGLAIVKNLVELMGGDIRIESKMSEGTKVVFQFTYQTSTKEEYEAQAIYTSKEALSNCEGIRALVVEDQLMNREIIRKMLNKVGVEIEEAENGQVAVDMVEKSQPYYYDIIFMDIRMPVMNGVEATRAIRALPREDAASIPIIALTANAFPEDVEETLKAGVNAHLEKPINKGKVMESISTFVKHS